MRKILAVLLTVVVLSALSASGASASYAGRDGRIAFVRSNQVYTMSTTGTNVTKLTTSGKNYRPHFSPDGKRIAYINETAAGVKNLWVMTATGASKQAVTTEGGVTTPPAWSPNGAQLAFGRNGVLNMVKSTSPFGTPVAATYSSSDCDVYNQTVKVDRWLAWSASNEITVLNSDGCDTFDTYMWKYDPAAKSASIIAETGASCCSNEDWTELFYGPTNQLGVTERYYGYDDEFPSPPMKVIYPFSAGYPHTGSFVSADGDTGGAPSPSGTYIAVTNASSGTARVFKVSRKTGARTALATGYQPDWQRVS
jgi:Tol biopolymer transport system component